MLDLSDMRKVFSDALAKDPQARFRMDTAFAVAIETAYRKGIEDGRQEVLREMDRGPR